MPNHPNIPYLCRAPRAYRLQMGVNIALGITDVLVGLSEVSFTKQLIDILSIANHA